MNQESHLNPTQLEQLLAHDAAPEAPGLADLLAHLEVCTECRARLLLRQADAGAGVRFSEATSADPVNCPATGELQHLAAGLISGDAAMELLGHVAGCAGCARTLQQHMSELGEAEPIQLPELKSSTAAWQRRVAERMASATPAAQSSGGRFGFRWAWATAAVALLIAVAVAVGWRQSRATPSQRAMTLLAQAYSEHRDLEFRLPGAEYAPIRRERGGSRWTESNARYAEANYLLTRGETKSDDWWLARGRAHVLAGNPDAALADFAHIQPPQSTSPPVMLETAAAYFARGEQSAQASEGAVNRSQADFGKAADLLGQVLARESNNAVAAYNQGLVFERLMLYQQALRAWEHYLNLDHDSPWSAEARRHLAQIQQQLREHGSKQEKPLKSAGELASALRTHPPEARRELDSRAEDYLDEAVRHWLPEAFGSRPRPNAGDARIVLDALASELVQNHEDRWLVDLLASASGAGFPRAVAALAEAVEADNSGDADRGTLRAREAARLFAAAGNRPGVLRAGVEELYALQRATQGDVCARRAATMSNQIPQSYRWVATQFLLQQAICMNMQGAVGAAKPLADRALALARAAGYRSRMLRAINQQAILEFAAGDAERAFAEYGDALAMYWQGSGPAIYAFNFYISRADVAQSWERWWLEEALTREAIATFPQGRNLSVEAMAHSDLANAAMMAGDWQTSCSEFARAGQLFAAAPRSEATSNLRAENDIAVARLALLKNETERSRLLLRSVAPQLPHASSRFLSFTYDVTMGEIEWRSGNLSAAEQALLAAIRIAESGLPQLTSGAERLQWRKQADQAYRLLVQISLDRGDSREAWQRWEWYRAAPLRSAVQPAPTTVKTQDSLRWVTSSRQEQQDRGALLLSYARLPSGLVLWIHAGSDIKVFRLPVPAERIDSDARAFTAACADPASDPARLRRLARELYGWLIQPVADAVNLADRVVIEPDGVLASLPFEALQDADGRYFGDLHLVVLSPGIGYLARRRAQPAVTRLDRALVVGTPALRAAQDELVPLPEAREEAAQIAARFPNARLLSGADATVEAVSRDLPQAAIFHFAGHAVARGGEPGLLLSSAAKSTAASGVMGAESFPDRLLSRCKLAVLAACATARSGDDDLSDPYSLVRTFLGAGVPHVLASRWEVDSASAEAYMDSFYAALLAGDSVAESVRKASQVIRRQNPHPYYWAAFAAFGQP